MPKPDDAALADAEHYRPANTLMGYGESGGGGKKGRARYARFDAVVQTIPSYPSRCRATRIVPVVVGPKTIPMFGRRVLSQCRVRGFIELPDRRVARNKIHPQYPSSRCVISRTLRECERYTMSRRRTQRPVTV